MLNTDLVLTTGEIGALAIVLAFAVATIVCWLVRLTIENDKRQGRY